MDSKKVEELAKKLWDYHKLNHRLEPADLIFVMGSNDIRVADRGVELWREGLAPLIIFSGNRGRLTKDWKRTEAEVFAERAEAIGVPSDNIMIEKESTNTGENVLFTKKLLEEKGIKVKKIIGVLKPFMERRAYATIKELWPEVEILVTSPQFEVFNYHNDVVSKEQIINHLVGATNRVKVYADKGWQIPQVIPDDVWEAYEILSRAGYDQEIKELQ